jgi:hypothetical protein
MPSLKLSLSSLSSSSLLNEPSSEQSSQSSLIIYSGNTAMNLKDLKHIFIMLQLYNKYSIDKLIFNTLLVF